MKIYLLSVDDLYTGVAYAVDSNRRVPKNATTVEPPEVRDGYARKFDPATGVWEYIDKNTLGVPVPNVNGYRERLLVQNKASFDTAQINGAVLSTLGFWVDATRVSKADIDGIIQGMEAIGIQETNFRDYYNVFHTLNFDQVRTLQFELVGFGQHLYQRKWEVEAALKAAETREQLESIDMNLYTRPPCNPDEREV